MCAVFWWLLFLTDLQVHKPPSLGHLLVNLLVLLWEEAMAEKLSAETPVLVAVSSLYLFVRCLCTIPLKLFHLFQWAEAKFLPKRILLFKTRPRALVYSSTIIFHRYFDPFSDWASNLLHRWIQSVSVSLLFDGFIVHIIILQIIGKNNNVFCFSITYTKTSCLQKCLG